MTTQEKKKYRGGNMLRYEPQSLTLVNSDPAFRVSFEQAGCIRFCEKIQGYNLQLTKEFSLNYNGVQTTIVEVIFPVSEETIVVATKIPIQGEKWFKGMPLDPVFYTDFLKPKYRKQKIGATIPREYVLEPYEKLLRVIQRYFTCEGRFDRVYQYHVRLLMHFTGKSPLNLPFYLYRSLGKMADKVQARADQLKSSLFHFSLVKLLVVEELRKLNRDWDSFLASTNIPLDPKGDTPLSAEILASNSSGGKGRSVAEQGKGKGKEIEGPSPSQPVLKKGRRLQFTDEPKETQTPNRPTTRSAARRLPTPTVQTDFVEPSAQEMDEDQMKLGERDKEVREMQNQLKEAQHVIAQFYQESRELKRKLAEKVPDVQTSPVKAFSKKEISKGREVMQIPKTTVLAKPTTPLTRSSAKKVSLDAQDQPVEIEKPHTSPGEGEKTIKWLNKQLREAQDQIIQLREEKRISEDRIMKHFQE
jgi:hypothetical protein